VREVAAVWNQNFHLSSMTSSGDVIHVLRNQRKPAGFRGQLIDIAPANFVLSLQNYLFYLLGFGDLSQSSAAFDPVGLPNTIPPVGSIILHR